jgi:ribosome maturation factor RimP
MEVLTVSQNTELRNLAVAQAKQVGLELLRLIVRGTTSRPIIEVTLDGPRAVTLDDCQTISKTLQQGLDEIFQKKEVNYRLDVSSPGIDEPLIHDYQFERSMGKKVELLLNDGKPKSGVLKQYDANKIIIERASSGKKMIGAESGEITIERPKIKQIRTVADFQRAK